MLYCTYPAYQSMGGSLSEQAFDVLCRRASSMIDGMTFGRAAPHAQLCSDCAAALAEACCQIIDLMGAQTASGAVPGAQSVSNDGYSVTFADTSPSGTVQTEAGHLLAAALGADPHGLLYRGCC